MAIESIIEIIHVFFSVFWYGFILVFFHFSTKIAKKDVNIKSLFLKEFFHKGFKAILIVSVIAIVAGLFLLHFERINPLKAENLVISIGMFTALLSLIINLYNFNYLNKNLLKLNINNVEKIFKKNLNFLMISFIMLSISLLTMLVFARGIIFL